MLKDFFLFPSSVYTLPLIKGCTRHGGVPDIEEGVLGVERKREGEKKVALEGSQVIRLGSWFEFIALTFYLPEMGFSHPGPLIRIEFLKINAKLFIFYRLFSIHSLKTL